MQSSPSDTILDICRAELPRFQEAVRDIPYQAKGIFNSEMLLVCAITKHLAVRRILESGRARGQSTIVLSRFFGPDTGCLIDSVESQKYTRDATAAMKRLANIRNLRLRFGDASELLPRLASEEESVVLIDGPKGKPAVLLAAQLLRDSGVKAVFIHDMHRISEGRRLVQFLFPRTFFTDERRFVQAFRALDDGCWQQQRQRPGFERWAPYQRADERMPSYSATLAMILNEPGAVDRVDVCRTYLEEHQPTVPPRERWRRPLRTLKRLSKTPYWFIRYYLARIALLRGPQ